MMKLLLDADGCPVTGIAVGLANRYQVPCTIFCDTAHEIFYEGADTVTVSKGADSADLALVNALKKGDVVVTQDYGLAAMCLSKGARVLHQDGYFYTDENIDSMLFFRAAAKRHRRGGGRLKGPAARTPQQDRKFHETLEALFREATV